MCVAAFSRTVQSHLSAFSMSFPDCYTFTRSINKSTKRVTQLQFIIILNRRGFDEVHSAVGPSLLGVRWLGTPYRTVSVIHRSAAAALGVV